MPACRRTSGGLARVPDDAIIFIRGMARRQQILRSSDKLRTFTACTGEEMTGETKGEGGAPAAEEAIRPIQVGMKCNITHEIFIDGQMAFRLGEFVFVDDIVPNQSQPEYKYVVMSKELAFRKFQLSDLDLIPAPEPQEYKRKKRPARVWPFIKRHKVLLPSIVVGTAVIVTAAILLTGYGFKWKPEYSPGGKAFTRLASARGNTVALLNNGGYRFLYTKTDKGWTAIQRSSSRLTDVTTTDGGHTWITSGDGQIYFWDGVTFSKQFDTTGLYGMPGDSDSLSAVAATDGDHAWAVGTFLANSTDYQTTQGVVYTFDGKSWRLLVALGPQTQLGAVAAADPTHVWAASKSGEIFFYNGSTWALQTNTQVPITRLCAVDKDHAWAVSSATDKVSGRVFSFQNGKWGQSMEANMVSFLDISATDASHVWAVGSDDAASSTTSSASSQSPTQLKAMWRYDGTQWKNVSGPRGSVMVPAVAVVGPEAVWMCTTDSIYYGSKGL